MAVMLVAGTLVMPAAAELPGPVEGDFPISEAGNGWETDDETTPAVAWNEIRDEYLVVWRMDLGGDNSAESIQGRRVSATGRLRGPIFEINQTLDWEVGYYPEVVWNATENEYLVVWSRNPQGFGLPDYSSDIFGRRVSADGVPVGDEFRVSSYRITDPAAGEYRPDVAWNGISNQYLVIWSDRRGEGDNDNVYGRRLAADGSPLGGSFRVNGAGSLGNARDPSIAWNSLDNEYLVVWEDFRRADPAQDRWGDIFGVRLSPGGSRLGRDFRVSGNAYVPWSPEVAFNAADGEYLVAWEDSRRGIDQIYGRRLSASGNRLWHDFRISRNGLFAQYEPDLVWNATDDEYLVVWTDRRNLETRGRDIYGRRVILSGWSLAVRDIRISGQDATRVERWADVTWNAHRNEYFVVWTDSRLTSQVDFFADFNVYGRRLAFG